MFITMESRTSRSFEVWMYKYELCKWDATYIIPLYKAVTLLLYFNYYNWNRLILLMYSLYKKRFVTLFIAMFRVKYGDSVELGNPMGNIHRLGEYRVPYWWFLFCLFSSWSQETLPDRKMKIWNLEKKSFE